VSKANAELAARIIRGEVDFYRQEVVYQLKLVGYKKKGKWGSPDLTFEGRWALPDGTPVNDMPLILSIAGMDSTITLSSMGSPHRPFMLADVMKLA